VADGFRAAGIGNEGAFGAIAKDVEPGAMSATILGARNVARSGKYMVLIFC
jgi:hypothetical protein